MPTLCLNMIVKNESHVVEETLENICQYFDLSYWVISDTGSTDDTVKRIENFFKNKNIAGEIVHEPWQDFSHNRNAALQACAGKSDYILFFDADDLVEGTLNLPVLGEYDAYNLKMTNEQRALQYTRRLIIRNHPQFRWKGVLHEVIDSRDAFSETVVNGDYLVLSRRKGSRNLDPFKGLNDAKVLEAAFLKGDEDQTLLSRYAFYCAQSYNAHSAQDPTYIDKAIEWYKRRLSFEHPKGVVDDEKYISYQVIGVLFENKKQIDQAYHYWQQGIAYEPKRAECWYHLARVYHWNNQLPIAYEYAKHCAQLPVPEGSRIFINRDVHQYWGAYELAIISFKMGNIQESYDIFKQVVRYFPARVLATFEHMLVSYQPFLFKDQYQHVLKLQEELKQLNHTHYFEKMLAAK